MSSSKEAAKTLGLGYSDKELALITACVEFGTLNSVDFEKVAERTGYKDAKNARAMWGRLKFNKSGIKGNTKSDGGGTNSTTPKTPIKSGANRVTKSKKTPKSKAKVESSDEEEQGTEEEVATTKDGAAAQEVTSTKEVAAAKEEARDE